MAWVTVTNLTGPGVELQRSGGYLQWRVKGATGAWNNLLPLTDIQGAQGLPGVNAVDNDTAVGGYISTAGTSVTKTALESRFMKLVAQAVPGKVTVDAAVASAVAAGGGDVYIPAGDYTLTADLVIPRSVRLIGAGSKQVRLYAPTGANKQIKIKGGNTPFGWGGEIISGMSLDGVSILFGETTDDHGYGLSIRDLDFKNVAIGLTLRFQTFAFRATNCRFYFCSIAGIKHDFGPVAGGGNGSGSNISYVDCAIFSNTTAGAAGFWQDGTAIDGWHVSIVNCDIEHNDIGVKLTSVSEGVLNLTNTHFEGNQAAHIRADSGLILAEGVWEFQLAGGTPVANCDLSGTAQLRNLSGRVSFTAPQMFRLRDSAKAHWVPAGVLSYAMGAQLSTVGRAPTMITADSTNGYTLPSGHTTAKEVVNDIAIPTHGTAVSLLMFQNGDASTYEITGRIALSAAGANNNLILYLNPTTGGQTASFTYPTAATWAEFRLVWSLTKAHVTVNFSDGSAQINTYTLTHTLFSFRDFLATIGGTGTATGTVRNLIAKVI